MPTITLPENWLTYVVIVLLILAIFPWKKLIALFKRTNGEVSDAMAKKALHTLQNYLIQHKAKDLIRRAWDDVHTDVQMREMQWPADEPSVVETSTTPET